MRPFVTLSRMRGHDKSVSTRRARSYRPSCTPLEDRQLLSVTLSSSQTSPSLVGTRIVWTATASDLGQSPVYQFWIGPTGGVSQLVRDFNPSNSFAWTPLQEGSYSIAVTVKDSFGASTAEFAGATFTAGSRITGSVAVVSPTSNPLVALYSAPPASGASMHAEFRQQGSSQAWIPTAEQAISPGASTNILVAGMLPNTTYEMRHILNDGTTSATSTFTTGSLPTNLTFPTFNLQLGPLPGSDPSRNFVLHAAVNPQPGIVTTTATDLNGNIVWYYDPVVNSLPNLAVSVVPGGTVLLLGGTVRAGSADILREVNLAGDTLRETDVNALNAQLAAKGLRQITRVTHDAQRLPNGDTAVVTLATKSVKLRGKRTLYEGNMVLVLDRNFQVKWAWDPFKFLNVRRLGTLGEGPRDWTHANSVAWSPSDGNLILSMRSQDWVIKINYANGAGDGRIIWRLGRGGNFRIKSRTGSPWFSHQHDVRYINDTTLVLFDNGNTRRKTDKKANSRGQVLILDEKKRVATLVVNANLGNYAMAVGSAQALPNGNFVFNSGFTEQTIQVRPDGTKTYVLKMNLPGVQYRSYMYATLDGKA